MKIITSALVAAARLSPTLAWGRALESRSPTGSKSVIIQMFQWTWDSVATECTDFIGPASYGFVQVSPPQEHITGSQWWTDYQPVSYNIVSKRGNRSQFETMVSTCHAAGVKVIADTIWNHMSGQNSGVGIDGSSFTHYSYPGIYEDSNQDFHHCGLEPNDDIVNYSNRLEVQTCELVNLADLATETEHVRARLAAYGNDLLSLGIDGFRLDAAKHIASSDIGNILSRLARSPYITQEVINGPDDVILPSEYVANGDVQEFRYTFTIRDVFQGGDGIASLQNLEDNGWVAGTSANVFVANHDTERNGGSLRWDSPSNTYITATVFSLAHPYGTPTVLSSYAFTDMDAGAPNNGQGSCSGSGGSNGWLCQHRMLAISGMVGFRNTVGTTGITNWVSPQSQQIAFGRGSAGFVAINNADSDWTATFTTSLPNGNYCDVVNGTASGGSCSGPSVSISGGQLTAIVAARNAIAFHVGALGIGSSRPGGSKQPTALSVTFEETAMTTFGENIFLVGSVPSLGSWAPSNAIALSAATYPLWNATVLMPPNIAFEYKFIRKETNGSVIWESDPNRQATVAASGSQILTSLWR